MCCEILIKMCNFDKMCNCIVIMNTTALGYYCNILPLTWMLFQIQWWLSVLLGLCNFLSILCLKRLVEQLFYITVEATKMCLKLKNLPKNGQNIHLDTLCRLRKGGSSDSRQLVYSNSRPNFKIKDIRKRKIDKKLIFMELIQF